MKITILASGQGEKAIYLYEFFKEGNRIEVDSLLTDNPSSPIAERFRNENIEVITVSPEDDSIALLEKIKGRGVELLVADDYEGHFPAELKEAFRDAIVYPSTATGSPLEVISVADRIFAPRKNKVEEQKEEPAESNSGDSTPQRSHTPLEREWAEVLEVDLENKPEDTPQQDNVEEGQGEIPEIPENVKPPYTPQPPEPPTYNNPEPPQYPGQMPPQYGGIPPQIPVPPQTPSQREMPSEPMPDTYLVWSVLITILCCLIPGIVAIIFSSSVSSKYYAGDIEGARRASRNAQIWCIISIVSGVIWATLYLPLSLLLP